MNSKTFLSSSAAVLLLPALGVSQSAGPSANPDADFVQTASADGMGELRLAQLAEKQGMSDLVKQFAARLETDQVKANGELEIIAAETQLPLASSLSAKDGAFYDTLTGLSGTSFDGVYISAMVTDHREDIAAFQKEAEGGKNKTVREFAQRMLPTLKQHLQLAEQAASRLGVYPTATGGR